MSEDMHIGIAVTRHAGPGVSAEAKFSNVSVTGEVGVRRQVPLVRGHRLSDHRIAQGVGPTVRLPPALVGVACGQSLLRLDDAVVSIRTSPIGSVQNVSGVVALRHPMAILPADIANPSSENPAACPRLMEQTCPA